MSQNCLGLVIRCMRDGNAAEAMRSGNGSEELIAQAPSSIFQIPAVAARLAGHIGPVGHKIKPKFSRKPGGEQFVCVRVAAAKLMMKMQNKKPDTELRTQIGEEPQERHRIRAARNPNA